jgi:hypothetical protein
LNLSIPLTRLLRSRPLPDGGPCGERYSTSEHRNMTARFDTRCTELVDD